MIFLLPGVEVLRFAKSTTTNSYFRPGEQEILCYSRILGQQNNRSGAVLSWSGGVVPGGCYIVSSPVFLRFPFMKNCFLKIYPPLIFPRIFPQTMAHDLPGVGKCYWRGCWNAPSSSYPAFTRGLPSARQRRPRPSAAPLPRPPLPPRDSVQPETCCRLMNRNGT